MKINSKILLIEAIVMVVIFFIVLALLGGRMKSEKIINDIVEEDLPIKEYGIGFVPPAIQNFKSNGELKLFVNNNGKILYFDEDYYHCHDSLQYTYCSEK